MLPLAVVAAVVVVRAVGLLIPLAGLLLLAGVFELLVGLLVCAEQRPTMLKHNAVMMSIFVFIDFFSYVRW
ncbi:MAG: hypothetical protein QOG67_827 [Verrucomicrobiota bacterium]|jgi:uncharacterized membrane protein (GlpM family)